MKKNGFTIVELLIVIVVIGILAAITIVAFNGVQTRSQNAARFSELMSWRKSFEAYMAQEGNYPAPAGYPSDPVNPYGYCLGTGFPIGAGGVARCRNYGDGSSANPVLSYIESDNTALMTEIKKVSSLPNGPRKPIDNLSVGPYVIYNSTGTIDLYTILQGSTLADCPSPTTGVFASGIRVQCRLRLG